MANQELETREFIRHYAGTFVRVKTDKDGDWKCAWFHSGEFLRSDNIPISLHFGNDRDTFHLPHVEFDVSPVKFGLYPSRSHGKCPLLVSRFPHRQWKWGLCQGNIHIHNALSRGMFSYASRHLGNEYGRNWSTKTLLINTSQLDFQIAKEILFPEYSEYQSAVEALKKLKASFFVLDRETMVSLSPSHDGLFLWKWDVPVAKLSFLGKETTEVKIIAPIFRQEVFDFYSRKGIKNVHFKN